MCECVQDRCVRVWCEGVQDRGVCEGVQVRGVCEGVQDRGVCEGVQDGVCV